MDLNTTDYNGTMCVYVRVRAVYVCVCGIYTVNIRAGDDDDGSADVRRENRYVVVAPTGRCRGRILN